MKRKEKNLLIILVLVAIITALIVSLTYSRYTSQRSQDNNTVAVAQWSFSADGLNVARTVPVEVNQIVENKLAPGTSGTINVKKQLLPNKCN